MGRRYDIGRGAVYGFCDFLPYPGLVTKALFDSGAFDKTIDHHMHLENGPHRKRYVSPDPLVESRDDFVVGYYLGVAGGSLATVATLGIITVCSKLLKNKVEDRLRHLETIEPREIKKLPED